MNSHIHNFSISTKTSTDTKWQYRISSSKFSRSQITQRNIDKETLIQENQQLKMQINNLHEELTATRVKYHHLEKEQYSGAIDDRSTLVQKLKKSLKIAENSLLQKLREIDEFKKTSRFTKLQELEIELQNYQQETIRLKKLNDQQQRFLNQNNEQFNLNDYELKEQTIKKLCRENLQLMRQEAQLKSQNQQLKFLNEKLEIEIVVKAKENTKLLKQKQNNGPNQENQQQLKTRQQIYRESVERAQLLSRIDQVDRDYGKQLKEKDVEISRLISLINQKNQQIEEYEKASMMVTEKNASQYDQLTLDNQVSDALKKRESKVNAQSLHKLSIITASSNERIKKKSFYNNDQNYITKSKEDQSNEQFDEIAEFTYGDDLITELKPNKKFNRINFHEIQPIGKQLKLELQIKMVALEECEQIFDEYDELSISDLNSIFSVEPFKIMNHDERKLLSRYLIEDNNEELIEYDPYRISSIPFIKSVFRQLVCRYELFHEMEIKKLQMQLSSIFLKIYYLFNDALQTMTIKKKYLKSGTCEKSDFEEGLRYCDTYLTPRQLEYIQYLNYVEFKEIQFIHYQQIITNLRANSE